MLSLLLFILIPDVYGYNLVIDVNPQSIHRFLESFGSYYEQQLENHEIPMIEKERCLGRIAITKSKINQVQIESTKAEVIDGDYYLKIAHLHAHLDGDYKHNILFVHQRGDFGLRIRDLNATLGPLVPVAIAGLPFIDNVVGCRISHAEDNFDVHGGILRVIAKKRLKETIGADLENLLCDSFTDILDKGIRETLKMLQLKSELTHGYYEFLKRPPLLLPSGGIRVFHEGITSQSSRKHFRFDVETIEAPNFDVIFYIHENLITEALTTVCKHFEKEVLSTKARCLSVTANFTELGKAENVLLTAELEENGQNKTRIYNSRLLHSEKLVLFMRLKSEILSPGTKSDDFSRKLFTVLSEDLRSKFQVALPIPKPFRMDNMQVLFKPDRLILVGNLR